MFPRRFPRCVPLLGIPAENLAHFALVFDNDPVALNRCTVRGPTAKDVCRIGGSGDVNVVARCPVGTVPVIARADGVLGGVLRRVRSHLELLSGQIVRERGCLGLGEFVRTGRLRGADRQKNGGKKRRWGALPRAATWLSLFLHGYSSLDLLSDDSDDFLHRSRLSP